MKEICGYLKLSPQSTRAEKILDRFTEVHREDTEVHREDTEVHRGKDILGLKIKKEGTER